VGRGASSPIVAGGRLYCAGWANGRDTVCCLDAATGAQVWSQAYGCPPYGRYHAGDEGAYDGVSPTPTYDPATGRLYTLGTDGDLNCWDARREGAWVWGLNLYDTFAVRQRPAIGPNTRDYGYTTSPLIYADWAIVEVGADSGALVAFDKATGVPVWRSECTEPAGHTGGLVPMVVEGIPCVAVLTLRGLLVARLDPGHEGATLATYPWETDFANNVPTPAAEGDTVILTTGYNLSKMARLRIGLDGVRTLWERRTISKVCSPVIYRGHVYFAWGRLRCLDLATGEQMWAGGAFSDDSSCLITGDGRLVVHGSRTVALVETADRSPDAYRELASRSDVGQAETWPHIALAAGGLYAKDREGNLYAFVWRPPE
jgi:outer membrane protein assembly factor BamB